MDNLHLDICVVGSRPQLEKTDLGLCVIESFVVRSCSKCSRLTLEKKFRTLHNSLRTLTVVKQLCFENRKVCSC